MQRFDTSAEVGLRGVSNNDMETSVPVRPLLTQRRLKELLAYDPQTGIFTRKTDSAGSAAKIGDPVGGYRERDDSMCFTVDGRQYQLHNLAWLYVHGEFPAKQLLRRDDNGRNNAIANLMLPVVSSLAELTQARVQELLHYDPDTGVFTWRIRSNKRSGGVGTEAGTVDPTGRRYIGIDGTDVIAARLAWLYVYGTWPDQYLRMKNNDHRDIRIENLVEGFALDAKFDHRTPEGRAGYDRAFRHLHPERVKARDLRRDFGIDLADYQAMFVAQAGVCASCKRAETEQRNGRLKWLTVDHDHDTGGIRGLLCVSCNTGIGKFGDDPAMLRAAADYLERYAAEQPVNVIPLKARGRRIIQ